MKTFREYEKIETLYIRDDNTKKLVEGKYRNKAVEYLKDNQWGFTEKIDGTNIRVYWDGHKVSYFGRTENAQIPTFLMDRLAELFGGTVNEEMFEQTFGDKEVMLIGEGYGPKIQKVGKLYRDSVDFILFDVIINGNYQDRKNIESIANTFGIDCVPIIFTGTIDDAVKYIKNKPKSTIGTANMEGLVGKPMIEMQDRVGNRIIVKIKTVDFDLGEGEENAKD